MRLGERLVSFLGENGERWCQGEMAMDAEGNRVHPLSHKAERYCLYGALTRLGLDEGAYRRVSRLLDAPTISIFNDTKTWPEIKACLLRDTND